MLPVASLIPAFLDCFITHCSPADAVGVLSQDKYHDTSDGRISPATYGCRCLCIDATAADDTAVAAAGTDDDDAIGAAAHAVTLLPLVMLLSLPLPLLMMMQLVLLAYSVVRRQFAGTHVRSSSPSVRFLCVLPTTAVLLYGSPLSAHDRERAEIEQKRRRYPPGRAAWLVQSSPRRCFLWPSNTFGDTVSEVPLHPHGRAKRVASVVKYPPGHEPSRSDLCRQRRKNSGARN